MIEAKSTEEVIHFALVAARAEAKDAFYFLEPVHLGRFEHSVLAGVQREVSLERRHVGHWLLADASEEHQLAAEVQERSTLARLRNPVVQLHFLADEESLARRILQQVFDLLETFERLVVHAEVQQRLRLDIRVVGASGLGPRKLKLFELGVAGRYARIPQFLVVGLLPVPYLAALL